jgi:hypothetical protein
MLRLAIVLALAACKGSDAPKTEPAPAAPAPAPSPSPSGAPAPPPPQAAGDLPAPCTDYKGLIDQLAACQKVPAETRDGLRKAFEQSWTSWEKAADKSTIERECRAAADNLRAAAGAACGW